MTVDVASFEEWLPRERLRYDLIFCAQAFNWLDPAIRYKKCHELLKDGGYLAIFWYGECARTDWAAEIVSSGFFQQPQVFDYQIESHADANTWVKIVESTAAFAALCEEDRARAREEARATVEQQGGVLTTKLDYRMFIARRA